MPIVHGNNDKLYGGDIRHSVILIDTNNNAIDITEITLEFNIYESIFRQTMSASFVLRDASGVIDSLPLVGQELIAVQFSSTASSVGPLEIIVFKVYKISDRQKISTGAFVYNVKASSIEHERNLAHEISPYYKDKTGSEIVKDIFDSHIKNGTNKEVYVEDSENIIPFTGASHSPFEIIDYIAKRSRSKTYGNKSHYLFYETRQGYNFRTLADLLSQGPYEKYTFSDPADVNNPRKENAIIGFTFLDMINTTKLIRSGYYKNEVNVIDPITKSFNEYKFDYSRDYKRLPHISGGGEPTIKIDTPLLTEGLEGPGHRRMIIDNLNSVATNNRNFDNRIDENNDPHTYFTPEQFTHLNLSIAQIASLQQHGINITVPANLNLVAGDIITIQIPTGIDTDDAIDYYIKHYGNEGTANFLITSLSFKMTVNGDYVSSFECVKQSFAENITGRPVFSVEEDIISNLVDGFPASFQDLTDIPFSTDQITNAIADVVNGSVNPGDFVASSVPDINIESITNLATTFAAGSILSNEKFAKLLSIIALIDSLPQIPGITSGIGSTIDSTLDNLGVTSGIGSTIDSTLDNLGVTPFNPNG